MSWEKPRGSSEQNVWGCWVRRWAWFAPWTGTYGPTAMPTATVVRIYQSAGVFTLDEANVVPSKFTSITRMPGGVMQLMGKGPRGATTRVFTSTNVDLPIGSWSNISTGKFSGGVFTSTDPQATYNPQRFYRVRAN